MTKFYGVGIGPGDENYLTLAAVKALNEVDVVFCPRAKDSQESLALSIAKNYVKEDAEIISQTFLMTKDRDKLDKLWKNAVDKIRNKLNQKKNVAFITLGDPSLYSTYGYVLNHIRGTPNVEIITIPGIPAFLACSAALNLPLVEKDERLALIPATNLSLLDSITDAFSTIVLYKIGKNLKKVIEYLEQQNLLDKSYLVSKVSTNSQLVRTNLTELNLKQNSKTGYMSTIIIKK